MQFRFWQKRNCDN